MDEDAYEDLVEYATEQKVTVSAVIREAIELFREKRDYEARKRAVDAIAAMEIEEMPDPDELARQMNARYGGNLP
jgi:hypothetical protein